MTCRSTLPWSALSSTSSSPARKPPSTPPAAALRESRRLDAVPDPAPPVRRVAHPALLSAHPRRRGLRHALASSGILLVTIRTRNRPARRPIPVIALLSYPRGPGEPSAHSFRINSGKMIGGSASQECVRVGGVTVRPESSAAQPDRHSVHWIGASQPESPLPGRKNLNNETD